MKRKIICVILLCLIIFSEALPTFAMVSEEVSNEVKVQSENELSKKVANDQGENENIIEDNNDEENFNEKNNTIEKKEINDKESQVLENTDKTTYEEENKINEIKTYSEGSNNIVKFTTPSDDVLEDGLTEVDGNWRVVVNGEVDYNYNGLARNENGLWYVKDGTILFDYTGIYTDTLTNNLYVVEENKVIEKDGLEPLNGGVEWYLIQNGKVAKDYNDLYENGSGLWFVKEGKILFDYDGTLYKGNKAYIIEKNKVCAIIDEHTTEMLEINGKWRMLQDGKVNYTYTGLAKNENGTWYFDNGELTFKYNGTYTDEVTGDIYVIEKNRVIEETQLLPLNGGEEWYLIQNGKVAKDYNDLYENGSGLWFVKEGKILFDYDGTLYKGNKAYIIEKNKVCAIIDEHTTEMLEINGKWRMVQDGKVNYTYTGISKNENGTWYFDNGELTFKYNGTYTDEVTGDIYVIEKNRVIEETQLLPLNGGKEWYLIQNGKVAKDYNDLYENGSGLWFVKEGKILFDYDGTLYKGNKAYIIEKNKVCAIIDEHTTEMLEINGKWRMVQDGKVNYTYTGISKNENGTWYFDNGELTFKYNGTYTDEVTGDIYVIEKNRVVEGTDLISLNNGTEWLLVRDGKFAKDYNDLYENDSGLWFVKEGKILFDYDGTLYKGDKAYIIEKNKVYVTVDEHTTEMLEINGKWRMVQDGKVNYTYTGLAKNENGTWYFDNGELTFKYNGTYTDEVTGDIYVIEKNRVVEGTDLIPLNNGTEWLLVRDGKFAKDYNDLYENDSGLWFVKEGKILFDYDGTLYKGDKAYIIEKNKVYVTVDEHTTEMLEINGKWRMVQDGKVNYTYTGISKNENGTWYFDNGELTFEYNGTYTDSDGVIYVVEENKIVGIFGIPGYSANMKIERPTKANKYVSDMLNVSGWALSTEKDDKIFVYVDGILIGEATREEREDVFEEFCNNEFGGIECTPMPGFYFDLSTAKLSVGKHIITVKNIASDGETVIQSRDVEFYVMALTRTLGIDVSHYQGEIDWDAVKKSGVTFALLKIGEYWSSSKKVIFDQFFERNYWACKRLGIAVGGYFYSYAFNRAEGIEEADVCLSLIKNKRFELPIFIDVEDKAIKKAVANGKTDKTNVTDASLAFCEKMVNAGHQAGVYASRNFFYDYFDIPLLEKYWIWVAHYTSNQTDYTGKYNFWQYTSDGNVNGINGRVDLDWFYQR